MWKRGQVYSCDSVQACEYTCILLLLSHTDNVRPPRYNTPIKPGDVSTHDRTHGRPQTYVHGEPSHPKPSAPPSSLVFDDTNDPPMSGAAVTEDAMRHTTLMHRVLVERDSLLQRRSELIGKLTAHHAAREERQRADEAYHKLIQTVATEEVMAASVGAPHGSLAMSTARIRLEEEALSRSRAQLRLDEDREALVHEYVVSALVCSFIGLSMYCTCWALLYRHAIVQKAYGEHYAFCVSLSF